MPTVFLNHNIQVSVDSEYNPNLSAISAMLFFHSPLMLYIPLRAESAGTLALRQAGMTVAAR